MITSFAGSVTALLIVGLSVLWFVTRAPKKAIDPAHKEPYVFGKMLFAFWAIAAAVVMFKVSTVTDNGLLMLLTVIVSVVMVVASVLGIKRLNDHMFDQFWRTVYAGGFGFFSLLFVIGSMLPVGIVLGPMGTTAQMGFAAVAAAVTTTYIFLVPRNENDYVSYAPEKDTTEIDMRFNDRVFGVAADSVDRGEAVTEPIPVVTSPTVDSTENWAVYR